MTIQPQKPPDYAFPKSWLSILGIWISSILLIVIYIFGAVVIFTLPAPPKRPVFFMIAAVVLCAISMLSGWMMFTSYWLMSHQYIRSSVDRGSVVVEQAIPWWINPFRNDKPDTIPLKGKTMEPLEQGLLHIIFHCSDVLIHDGSGEGYLLRYVRNVDALTAIKDYMDAQETRQTLALVETAENTRRIYAAQEEQNRLLRAIAAQQQPHAPNTTPGPTVINLVPRADGTFGSYES